AGRNADLLSDDFRVTAKSGSPKWVGQNNDAISFVLHVVLSEGATKEWLHAQDIKNLRSDGNAPEVLRIFSIGQSTGRPSVSRHCGNALILITEIGVIGKGMDVATHGSAVIHVTPPQHHDFIRIL